jgi:osmoprotectant transport system ATP-binding protein
MITLDRLTKSFGTSGQTAVDGLSLTINAGEICVLIGPSGCGKTTTMRMINRMVEPDSGRIEVDGQDVTRIDAVELRRSIG